MLGMLTQDLGSAFNLTGKEGESVTGQTYKFPGSDESLAR
jgi:hypothetical protein